jgi:hypothetical protein
MEVGIIMGLWICILGTGIAYWNYRSIKRKQKEGELQPPR